jgi:threonine dehydratase
MRAAFKNGAPIKLEKINTFVDGASIKKSGKRTFEILREVLHDVTLVDEGHICTIMHSLFNAEGRIMT